jgi:DNA-binding transcriptional ArsR family regulator
LEALGDSTRRGLFEILCRGPQSVGQLAAAVPVSRPAVSQHLRVLKDAGLVTDRAEGTRRIYRVAVDGVEDLRAYIDGLWDTALAGFASAVEQEARTMSTEQTVIEPVKKSVTVNAPVALAAARHPLHRKRGHRSGSNRGPGRRADL